MKHKECKNFRDGHCVLNDVDVDPEDDACGSFEAK